MNVFIMRMVRVSPLPALLLTSMALLAIMQVASAQDAGLALDVAAVDSAQAGTTIEVVATLLGPDGKPVEGQDIEFTLSVEFLSNFDDISLGIARTDDTGTARIEFIPKSEGDHVLTAGTLAGADEDAFSQRQLTVTSGGQLYRELSPVRVPGANVWMATGVLLAVWGVFLLIALRIWQIARMGEDAGGKADA